MLDWLWGVVSLSILAPVFLFTPGIAAAEEKTVLGGVEDVIRLPITGWRHIRTPEGLERRPVVEVEICLGSKRFRTLVNLTDRSMVKYPLILGRNSLGENFLVDVKRRRILPPSCPDTH